MTKPKSKPKAATRSTARKTSKPKSRTRSAPASSKTCSAARYQARPHHCDAADAGWRHDRRYHDRNRMAAAFGARLSCRRGSQEARAQPCFRANGQGPGLSHQGWQRFVCRCRTGPSRRPDAMQKKRRNGRASTKTSVEDEIAHLRGLDLKGLTRTLAERVSKSQPPLI